MFETKCSQHTACYKHNVHNNKYVLIKYVPNAKCSQQNLKQVYEHRKCSERIVHNINNVETKCSQHSICSKHNVHNTKNVLNILFTTQNHVWNTKVACSEQKTNMFGTKK